MTRNPTAVADQLEPTRHEQLSTSTTSLAAASAPQAAFEVTTLADVVDAADGVLSLREAITAANATAGADTIGFADSIRGGTITLTLGNLVVTDDLQIDGDPADGGAAGIVLDGNFPRGVNGPGANIALEVRGSDLAVEDLTVRNGGSANIAGDNAHMLIERASIFGAGQSGGPAGSNIEVSGGSLGLRNAYLGPSVGKESFVSIAVLDGADVSVTDSWLQSVYHIFSN